MSYFNAGILVMNIQGMRIKYQQFVEMMKKDKDLLQDFLIKGT